MPGRFEQSSQLARIAALAVMLAIILRFGFGRYRFSFYGLAAIVLVVVPLLTGVIVSVHQARGWRRRPVWLLAIATALAGLLQIGFWLTFFHDGSAGLGLGLGRSMFQSLIEVIAATIPPALGVIWLLLLARISR